jgi:hypothetical protein
MSDAAFAQNRIGLKFRQNLTVPSDGDISPALAPLASFSQVAGVSPLARSIGGTLHVVEPRRAYLNLIGTANDAGWAPPNDIVGGVQVLTADASGAGAGLRAAIRARAAGPAQSTTVWDFTAASQTAKDVVVFQLTTERTITKVPLQLPPCTLAELAANFPAADFPSCLGYVTDAAGGKHIVVSNGTIWKYMDGTAV